MTGIPLIVAFVVAVVLMIVAISKWKVHPFLSIMAVSVLLALVAGIPLVKTGDTNGIADVIGAGFSPLFVDITFPTAQTTAIKKAIPTNTIQKPKSAYNAASGISTILVFSETFVNKLFNIFYLLYLASICKEAIRYCFTNCGSITASI